MTTGGLSLSGIEDVDQSGGIIATTFVVTILACLVVALRLATRIWLVKNVGWDDYAIIAATFGIIIGCGLVIVQIHYGFGRHRVYLTDWEYIEFTKYAFGEWIQTFQTLMFTKLSICFFLLRLPVKKGYVRPIQGTIGVLIVSNIILTLVWCFQCNPTDGAWNKKKPANCFTDAQLQRIILSQGIISIVSDFLLALFPIVLLWKVQIATRIKAGLCALMSLGLLTAACCIVRTALNYQNINNDTSFTSIPNWYWRSWEVCIGIIATCIPALRPGYKFVVTGIISSYHSQRSSGRSSGAQVVKGKSDGIILQQGQRQGQGQGIGYQAQCKGPSPAPERAESRAKLTAAAKEEEGKAEVYGAGAEGFGMKSLVGDRGTVQNGIMKTTKMEVDGARSDGSSRQESMSSRDLESGERYGESEEAVLYL